MLAGPRGGDPRLAEGGRATRDERREQYEARRQARRDARAELAEERRAGVWTDPDDGAAGDDPDDGAAGDEPGRRRSRRRPGRRAMTGRDALRSARRIVVKVGSSSLTTREGGLDAGRLGALVDALAARRLGGCEVVLVSSGAIAAGLAPLGLARRPKDLATQQAAASVGQGRLVAEYTSAFARHGLTVGQVLLTADDVVRRGHYVNAHRTLERLLGLGVIPVVNENDTVATQEIRFGDNDRLAALVAHLVGADALVLLSDVDALYDGPPGRDGVRRVPLVRGPEDVDGIRLGSVGATGVGSGGMVTKVEAAGIAAVGGRAHPADGGRPGPGGPGGGGRRDAGSRCTAAGAPAGCCGWPTPPVRRGGSCSTTARSPPSSSGGCRCCRPGSPGSRGRSRPGTRSSWRTPGAAWSPAAW